MSTIVRAFYDDDNDDWIFTVDPTTMHGSDAADAKYVEIRDWCTEHFGPPSKSNPTVWYASPHRAFSVPDPAQAFEFKMRWVTPS